MKSETEKDPLAKKCPECFEKNKPMAKVCKWCNYRYSEEELEAERKAQELAGKVVAGCLAVFVFCLFCFWLVSC